ncbi:RNB domain-containing ribonuclease [Synechococcus sp. CBW1107]|uniref:RNB domain-containing ribonuclease n=1 Tax=Synechococcus sp. CBW1107 TaxID=2789857 RepID=UPI002AD464B2|nr:RNB domain-containing ribonuclease [Synechococcus sp. CBW1107]CAK6688514.1 Ribonuclease R [Synechococcus sp. CBW1107]
MNFTVANLIDQLPAQEQLSLSTLEQALGLGSPSEQQQLRIALTALVRVGVLQETDQGISRVEDEDLIEARLRCSSKGFCFALREDGGEDIYIRDNQLNHAWNGDRVLVRITREGGRRRSPEGGVQCILERNTTSLLAQVEQHNERLLAVPLDDRLLTNIELPSTDSQYLKPADEAVVEVRVDRYPVGQLPSQGHVARSLAVNAGPEADLDLLITKHGLRELPAAPRATLKSTESKDREDLTALPTFLLQLWSSVEAPILPAVSLESSETGHKLWVHAPAVAERLGFAGALDLHLRDQAEALCLGGSWIPMLPANLTKAAAFKAGSSEAALSVVLELSPEGDLQHYRFCRSTIKPDGVVDAKALTALAERKPKARTTPAALKALKDQLPLLEQLIALAEVLRQKRLASGSIDLDLAMPAIEGLGDLAVPEPDESRQGWLVQLDPATEPAGLLRELVLPAHRALGRHLCALELPAIYAVNPAPEAEALNDVAKAALALEIPLELSADGNATAQELAQAFAGSDRCRVLQQQLRDPLKPVSFSAEAGANALAGETTALAPWCCPGLHYADLWNQHVLSLLLSEGKDRPSVRHKTRVDIAGDSSHGLIDWPLLPPSQIQPLEEGRSIALLHRLNGRCRFAADLQADALAMAQARQAEPLVGQTLTGVISGVQSYGFFVEVPPSQVEGLVHVSSLKDDWYEYRSRQNRLVGRKNRRSYMLGDAVEVTIQKVDVLRHQIDLAVVLPEGYEEYTPDAAEQDGPDESGDSELNGGEE